MDDNNKMSQMNRMKVCGLDSCGLVYGLVAFSRGNSNEHSGSINTETFLTSRETDSFVTK